MKFKSVFAVAVLSLFAIGARGQTNIAPPPTFHFVAGGSAVNFSGGSGNQVGSISYTGLQVTTSLSAVYEHLSVPSASYRAELGVLSYTRQLSSLLGSSLQKKILFDTSNMNLTFSGGFGKAYGTKSGIAETAGISLSYPIPGTSAAVQIIGYQYVHGAGMGGLIQRNQQVASSGLIVFF